jgi:RHS repeat-associated protein
LTYEKEVKANGITEHKHYLSAGGQVFALQVTRTGNLAAGSPNVPGSTQTSTLSYFHHDHLGSIAAITDENRNIVERLAYDPWGKRRYPNGASDVSDSLTGKRTDRGYTEHEHLDEMSVIHMNGRVYDPLIGRMMSADSYLQAPYKLQNFNRYSYVLNNPLKLVDETGYFFSTDNDGNTTEHAGPANPNDPHESESDPRSSNTFSGGGSGGSAPTPTGLTGGGLVPPAEPVKTGFWSWLSWFDNNVANPLMALGPIGAIGKVPRAAATAATAAEETVTLYRAVSKAELTDIAANGLRVVEGGYETVKLFATNLADAAKFGENNYKLDGVANFVMKVDVPKSVMDGAHAFTADGMKAVSIAADQLGTLKATLINYSPWGKR